MRTWAVGIAGALLLAGCSAGTTTRNVDAVLDAELEAGEALLTCRKSSSGTCHVLFITEATRITAQARQGETAAASGLSPETRYCLDVVAPDPNGCRPRPLVAGEQIVRSSSVVK